MPLNKFLPEQLNECHGNAVKVHYLIVGKEDSVHKFNVSINDYKNYVSKDKMYWEKLFYIFLSFLQKNL